MSRGFGENINKKKLSNPNGIIFKKLIEKAYLAQKSNKISEAEAIYEELFRFNVREPKIYFNYGLLLESQKKLMKRLMFIQKQSIIFQITLIFITN